MPTGLLFIYALGWLLSYDRKHIRYRSIVVLLSLQMIISFLCLHTSAGIQALKGISSFFNWLMVQADGGVQFVFGGIVIGKNASVFFLNVLMPIVFISALVGILNYIRILPIVIKWTGWLLNKVTGMGELESYFAVSTAILGEPEVFLTIKNKIPQLSAQRLYTICASAMSAVSAALLASYMKMIPGKFVVVAVFLNILSVLLISCIINPYVPTNDDDLAKIGIEDQKQPFFQVLGNYIQDGFKLAITVAAMLIGFVALVTFLNNSFLAIIHVSFTAIIGNVFSPIAWIMGVPMKDISEVGSIMATKLITNEFAAMGTLHQVSEHLSMKSIAIISTYLVSFANFGTVGIITGSIRSISEKQGALVAKTSLKLLLGATMASILTGTIVGFWF
ncbi:NupC/NupG family nucleoside CNT transporter [Levilactobacillus zymae]|uniref:NupC/NupG family nucleoside CNT transporter n=1 Tax=Levilactobacillus zymae TaxID=267363 RepID=UPI003FCE0F19